MICPIPKNTIGGREWNRAMVAAMASKDEEVKAVRLYEFDRGDTTIAAINERDARDCYLDYRGDDKGSSECREIEITDDDLFQDHSELMIHDYGYGHDGDYGLFGYREALDEFIFVRNWPIPFVFATTDY